MLYSIYWNYLIQKNQQPELSFAKMNIYQKAYLFIRAQIAILTTMRRGLRELRILPDPNSWDEAVRTKDMRRLESVALKYADASVSEIVPEKDRYDLEFISSLTYPLGNWMVNSRRVFAPSQELVNNLITTDLPPWKISEIHYVLGSFCIQLPSPIQTNDGVSHTTLLVTVEEDGMSIVSFSKKLFDKYNPLPHEEILRLIKVCRENDDVREREAAVVTANTNVFDWHTDKESPIKSFIFANPDGTNYAEAVTQAINSKWKELVTLVVGLNLYLQTRDYLTSSGTESTDRFNPSTVPDNEDVQILDLRVGKHGMAIALRDEETCTTGQTRVGHIRKGHWRRCSEKGLIWVRPHTINGGPSSDSKTLVQNV